MSLLREIQETAVSSDISMGDLLRKCKILAARLGNHDFKNWIDLELNGYGSQELPEYRILKKVNSLGHFSGAFGSGLRNADIPLNCFPQEYRNGLSQAKFISPIATLESLSKSNVGTLSQPWSSDFLTVFGSDIYVDMYCMQAWKVIPVASVIGIIDTVKTKILNFVLEIEAINPDAGEAILNSNPIPQEQVSQIFNINISGNVHNLSSGNRGLIQQTTNNNEIPEKFIELISKIKESKQGNNEILEELEMRIEELGRNVGTSAYKEKYLELMSFLSDHTTVISGLVIPFLPYLSSFLTSSC